jgi:subtilase family serine protease
VFDRVRRCFLFSGLRCKAFWACLAAAWTLAAGSRLALAQSSNLLTQQIDVAHVQELANHHPLWANPGNSTGAAPSGLALDHLTLVLARPPEQERAFQQLLANQQNPTSSEFHRWLTPDEVGERFGLSDHDLDAIIAWLESQGMHVNWVAPSRLFIGFGGTAAQIGQAFHTEMRFYRVAGVKRLSAASDPVIPQALIPVIRAVRGMYSIEDRSALRSLVRQSAVPQVTDSAGDHLIAPQDFRTIYDGATGFDGSGETIGIVGWSRISFADLDNFRARTGSGFPDPAEIVPTAYGGVDPGPANTAPPKENGVLDGQEEATVDVERAGSVAPGANLLLVVSAPAGNNDGIGADAQYLVQSTPAPAQVINIGFGDCESEAGPAGVAYWDTLFKQAAAEGISVIVSSGDSGASGCDTAFATPPASPFPNSPNYICSSSYATCVGGTEFNDASNPADYWASVNSANLGSALGYIPEGGWNEPLSASATPQAAASEGGVSRYIGTPFWQSGAGMPAQKSGRYTPDVSFSASCHDAYLGCLAAGGGSCVVNSAGSFSFEGFCGTSAAAPGMAGVAALLDEELGGPQGNLNQGIYETAANAPQAFHDVTVETSGVSSCSAGAPSMCNNSVPSPKGLRGGQTGYVVGPGYDEVTGLGSLDVANFLASYENCSAARTPKLPGFSISGTTVAVVAGAGTGNTITVTITPLGGFTGSVLLAAQVQGPAGAQDPPTVAWGSSNPLAITGPKAVAATLTVSTTARIVGTTQSRPYPGSPWRTTAGAALACFALFWIPLKRRGKGKMLVALTLLAGLAGGTVACTGALKDMESAAASGTTAGTYTITVTGTSGSTTASAAVFLVVE